METAAAAVVMLSPEQPYEVVGREAASARPALSAAERLHRDFPSTPIAVIQQLLQRLDGDVDATRAELASWSTQEGVQHLRDEDGREIFTWRVPCVSNQQHSAAHALSKRCAALPHTHRFDSKVSLPLYCL